jgi:hypothetical protein
VWDNKGSAVYRLLVQGLQIVLFLFWIRQQEPKTTTMMTMVVVGGWWVMMAALLVLFNFGTYY